MSNFLGHCLYLYTCMYHESYSLLEVLAEYRIVGRYILLEIFNNINLEGISY